jgi:ABC-type multidrug transport system fused ATPase/permease subunit
LALSLPRLTANTHFSHYFASPLLDDDWPSAGALSIDNVYLKYRPSLPPALSGVTADIRPGEHIGIVGKTVCTMLRV